MHCLTIISCWLCFMETVICDFPYNPSRPDATPEEYTEFQNEQYPSIETPQKAYDFIIIGSGPGGIPVASRLSEIQNWSILLVEAGDYETRATDVPGLSFYHPETPAYWHIDWNYHTILNPNVKNTPGVRYTGHDRTHPVPRARVVGGCSSHNGMMYARGHEKNFDDWENIYGNPGWGFQNISTYFQKMENYHPSDVNDTHGFGHGGPINIETPNYKSKLCDIYLESASQFGLKRGNYNNPRQDEFGRIQAMTKNGFRCSANAGYLVPIRNQRDNLHLMRKTQATKLVLKSLFKVKAVGVELFTSGQNYTVYAKKEIILSAGSINSAMLLILSGIGPSEHLKDLGISVVKDLPVGNRLMNRPTVQIKAKSEEEFIPLKDYDLYNASPKSGPWVFPYMSETLIFTGRRNDEPVREGYLIPAALKFNDIKTLQFQLYTVLLQQTSTGFMRLKNTNPFSKPNLYITFLSHDLELQDLLDGIRETQGILSQPAFGKWNFKIQYDQSPPCDKYLVDSDDFWRCRILVDYVLLDHWSGTCKMGPESDPTTVVNSELCVHGVDGLRVIDASIFPSLPTTHTTATVLAIGEKGADLIKNKWQSHEDASGFRTAYGYTNTSPGVYTNITHNAANTAIDLTDDGDINKPFQVVKQKRKRIRTMSSSDSSDVTRTILSLPKTDIRLWKMQSWILLHKEKHLKQLHNPDPQGFSNLQGFEFKYLGRKMSIKVTNRDDYNTVIQKLENHHVEYHTFPFEDNMKLRMVLCALPPLTETTDIKEDLQAQNLNAEKVVQMYKKSTGEDQIKYQMFIVTFKEGTKAADVIKYYITKY